MMVYILAVLDTNSSLSPSLLNYWSPLLTKIGHNFELYGLRYSVPVQRIR